MRHTRKVITPKYTESLRTEITFEVASFFDVGASVYSSADRYEILAISNNNPGGVRDCQHIEQCCLCSTLDSDLAVERSLLGA